MIKNIRGIRGMNDYLPNDTAIWQYIEGILKQVFSSYGYSEIRLPIVEYTPLFKRAIGKITDVVEKEMYTFIDRNGESLTLRPEGTAGCVRAIIEHRLLKQDHRFWYIGPMFRYERPQKGRYRQFYQIGAEVFGLKGPDIDAEIIMMTARCWKVLGITKYVKLELNSIGSPESRSKYCNALIMFLKQHEKKLDEDCKRRMYYNPLRVLDTKNKEIQELLNNSPKLSDFLDDKSRIHFEELCTLLDRSKITYTINWRLVRGLDYYNYTVFEWVTSLIGAKGTICAGGRYDRLVEQLGGQPTPSIGFAIGMERLVLLVQETNPGFRAPKTIDVYIISCGQDTHFSAIQLAEQVREAVPSLKIMTHFGAGSFKKQFACADKRGATIALVLGENEIKSGKVILKDLRIGEQKILSKSEVVTTLSTLFL